MTVRSESLFPSLHLLEESQINSNRYYFFSYFLILPPVAWPAPKNMSINFWYNSRRYSVEVYGSGDTCMIVESYTKQYPTREILSPEMLHLKTDPWPASWRQLSMGVRTISHMAGAAPLPCTRPWGGQFEGKGPIVAPIEGI